MKLLISFCNQQNNAIHDNLILLDTETEEQHSFFDFLYNRSITGLAQDHNRVYVCYQDQINGIVVLKKPELSVELTRSFPEIKDGHSLVVNNNELYVASTGNERILKFNILSEINKIEFVEDYYNSEDYKFEKDINHINSIFLYKSELYLSAFGKKNTEKWSSAQSGYILNTNTDEKIFTELAHPHSLNVFEGNYWYLESLTRKIKRNKDTILELGSGYVRGLAVRKDYFIIGTSSGRTISKSTQTENTNIPKELEQRECKVMIYEYSGNYIKKIKEFNFINKYQEIYDILILD